MYKVKNGELRIGWNSMNILSLAAGETMLTVRLKMTTASTAGKVLFFTLASNPLNELADGSMNVIRSSTLIMDGLKSGRSLTTEIDTPDRLAEMLMTAYPNPFSDKAIIKYTLPEDGRVMIDVTSILGSRVRILSDQQQTAGEYMLDLDGTNIVSGVYQVTLRFKSQFGTELIKTVRMIKQ
jgi:hypothetical protein